MQLTFEFALVKQFTTYNHQHMVLSASLYQEHNKEWLLVDHISRALSKHEQNWKSQIDWESLAKVFGMTMFRFYLTGNKFTAWSDHQPIVPMYNDMTKPVPARVSKHQNKVLDLTFKDRHIPGMR